MKTGLLHHGGFLPAIQPDVFDTKEQAISYAFSKGLRLGRIGHDLITDVVCQGTTINGIPTFVVFKQHLPEETKYFCIIM